MSGRLISSLFYVELDATPTFYGPVQICYLRICCRVPGPALLDLLVRLRRSDARLAYRGDERCMTIPLCDHALLDSCKDAGSFSLQVEVQVSSIHSVIEIKIQGLPGGSQSISHCPYKLEDLIRDQGLSSAFGTSDHGKRASRSDLVVGDNSEIYLAVDTLQRTIDRAIR
ncbi:hypothetical protein F5B17DRAFT_264320 [Nemania serpens]|nr:hypothetical protein F5B17DRAFT_264320 [Nemania serpens]